MRYLEVGKNIVISESAYSTIVYYAILEVEEVLISKFKRKELTERQLKQIVSLEVTDYGVEINVNIDICFGCNVEDICKRIQENVIETVHQNIGFKPACVNVYVTKVSAC